MTPKPIPPRMLTQAERDVLTLMISADFDGAKEIRAQLDQVRAVAVWVDGLPSIDVEVAGDAARAPLADGEIPVGAEVRDEQGEYLGEITVWTTDGFLSAVEYSWVSDEPPTRLPDTAAMTLNR